MPDVYWPARSYGHTGPLESRLSGTGRVADDLWLLAHHERSGKALLDKRPLGLGLAAGLLAELMLTVPAAIGLLPDARVMVLRDAPVNVREHSLLTRIAGEPYLLPVRDWLAFLARTAEGDVGTRLEQAGYVASGPRRFPGLPARRVPVDPDWAFTAVLRVATAVDLRRPPDPYSDALTGLAYACGLGYRLDRLVPVSASGAGQVVARLPPPLRALVAHTQVGVSTAVLSRTCP